MRGGLRWLVASVLPVVIGIALGLLALWVELGDQGIDVRRYLP